MNIQQKKGISTVTVILISVIVTAGVVGPAVYLLTQTKEVAKEVTISDIENFLTGADASDIKLIAEKIPQDILASILKRPREVTIGFIWSFPHDGSAWCAGSEVSMNWLLERYPFITGYRTEDVGPEQVNSIARSMIENQGCEIILNNDDFIGIPMFEIHNEYPDVWFQTNIVGELEKRDKNFLRHEARLYQAAYLCGLIAGDLTKTNAIGGVWSFPVAFLTRIVNGFALGVKEVNPDAKIYGGYVNSWYDPPTESEVTTSLIDTFDCDVIFSMTDSPVPAQVANEKGIWSMVPYGDMVEMGWLSEDVSLVTCMIYQRHVIWDQIVKEWLAGVETPENPIYKGYDDPLITEEGRISMIDISWNGKVGMEGINPKAKAAISSEVLQLVELRRNQMIEGSFDPYRYHKIVDIDGNVRYEAGEMPSDENLLMEIYFLENCVPPD